MYLPLALFLPMYLTVLMLYSIPYLTGNKTYYSPLVQINNA